MIVFVFANLTWCWLGEIGSVISYAQRAQSKTHMKLMDITFTFPLLEVFNRHQLNYVNPMDQLIGSMSRVASEAEFPSNRSSRSSLSSIVNSLEAVQKFKSALVLTKNLDSSSEEKITSDQQLAMEEILGAVLKDKAGPVIEAFVPGRMNGKDDLMTSLSTEDLGSKKMRSLKGVAAAMRALKRVNSNISANSNVSSTESLLNPNQQNTAPPLVEKLLQDNVPKSFLSKFHDESTASTTLVQHEPSLQPSFASSGFRLNAVKSNSMLAVLRAYGGVQDSLYREPSMFPQNGFDEFD